MEECREDVEEAVEHTASADRALKRPKIEEASGSKSPPHIIPAPSDHLHEVTFRCV